MGTARARSSDLSGLLCSAVSMWIAVAAWAAPADAAEMQRMALMPGCHVLGPSQHFDIGAYCLDQSRPPPPWGSVLSYVPASWDNGIIKTAAGAPMRLSKAVAAHAVQIEGIGDRRRVRIVNQSGGPVEVCVNGPTVAMGNGATYVGDLDENRDEIRRLLEYGSENPDDSVAHPADRSFHDDVQQELWDAVNAVDARRTKELSKQIPVMRSIVPNTGEAPTAESGASRCVGESTMVKVCTE